MDAPAAALATSPILGLLTPKPHALSAYLLEKGFVIRPVVPPTVPLGGERVRICLRAGMDEELLARLGVALEDWVGLQIREEKDASRGGAMEPGVMAIKARL